ncbi:hypothetical protein SVAN01_01335 [Stagonosporopsis vannaccii]|nr:hypothetical protein SVAN01_01335 [Stagonosporopsis vannaccii]
MQRVHGVHVTVATQASSLADGVEWWRLATRAEIGCLEQIVATLYTRARRFARNSGTGSQKSAGAMVDKQRGVWGPPQSPRTPSRSTSSRSRVLRSAFHCALTARSKESLV